MTTFNHISDIGQRDIVSSLEDNIKSFLDWAFMNIGGFVNVTIPLSTNTSGNHKLQPVSGDPSAIYPRVWESHRKEWIYETGVTYRNTSPISISGVYLNNNFLPAPSGSGSYSYYIDYPKGRVCFSNNVSANSSVLVNYSYRLIQTYKTSDNLIWKEIEYNNYNLSKVISDGNYSSNSIQLPAIMIQIAPRSVMIPYELGSTTNILRQDVLLHIFTENAVQRNNIIDILLKQKDKTLNLYNINKVIKDNKQPLNFRGEANPNRLNYDQISNNLNYTSNRYYIDDASLSEIESITSFLHHGVIRWSIEIFP